MKVGENQSGLAKVATLGGEDKEGGREGRRRRRRRSYPLSSDLVGLVQPAAADTARAADRQTERQTPTWRCGVMRRAKRCSRYLQPTKLERSASNRERRI